MEWFEYDRINLFQNKDKDLIIKSLNNYVEQLKFHFNLTDDEIELLIRIILQKKENKKWWKFW
jgi:hypothetical protein